MRGLRYHGPRDLRVDNDLPEPACGEYQVKVKPTWCGICGTDLHEYSTPTFIPPKEKPHALTGESMPIVIGHEFSGTVTEIGLKVPHTLDLQIGDKVAIQATISCKKCGPCEQGLFNCCLSVGFIGLSGGGGGISDFVCLDPDFVFKLPKDLALEVGALVGPLAIAWHAVDQLPFEQTPEDMAEVLVVGAGPIGLGVIQCLVARGIKVIIVAEVAEERQKLAKYFGATHIIDRSKTDLVKKSKEVCGGQGPNFALDCAGVPASVKGAVLSVRPRGTIINVAMWEKEVQLNPNNLVFGEKRYIGVLGVLPQDYTEVIKALGDGRLKPETMITSKIKMDRVVEDGFTPLIEEKNKHVKILVDCQA